MKATTDTTAKQVRRAKPSLTPCTEPKILGAETWRDKGFIQIPDGKSHALNCMYRYETIRPGVMTVVPWDADKRVEFGKMYTVESHPGKCSCTCKDMEIQSAKNPDHQCKHVKAMVTCKLLFPMPVDDTPPTPEQVAEEVMIGEESGQDMEPLLLNVAAQWGDEFASAVLRAISDHYVRVCRAVIDPDDVPGPDDLDFDDDFPLDMDDDAATDPAYDLDWHPDDVISLA